MSQQMGDTLIFPTAILDHNGIMGTICLPILTTAAIDPPRAKPPRFHMFQYSILYHTLEEWKSKVAVVSYTSISLARAMVRSLFDSLPHSDREHHPGGSQEPIHDATIFILYFVEGLQTILGETMDTVTAMCPPQTYPRSD
jgi:hypothetical protein